jgi:phosphoribosylformylglycinamidine synthase
MLWEIDIHPAVGQPDRAAARVAAAARELGLADDLQVETARGFLVQGKSLDRQTVERFAGGLLVDAVVERANIGIAGEMKDCGFRIADCGLGETSENPQSAIRNSQ